MNFCTCIISNRDTPFYKSNEMHYKNILENHPTFEDPLSKISNTHVSLGRQGSIADPDVGPGD